MATVKFPKFNPETDDYILYSERMINYFNAEGIKDTIKVPTLLSLIGASAYKLVRDLCYPHDPNTKTFEELNRMLCDHFAKKAVVWKERKKFLESSQNSDESVADYYDRLCAAASECTFGNDFELLLKMKFVTGMREKLIFDRLCEEKEDQKLEKFVEISKEMEIMIRDSSMNFVQNQDIEIQNSRQIEFDRQQRLATAPTTATPGSSKNLKPDLCKRCKKFHRGNCRALCYNCRQRGHWARECTTIGPFTFDEIGEADETLENFCNLYY